LRRGIRSGCSACARQIRVQGRQLQVFSERQFEVNRILAWEAVRDRQAMHLGEHAVGAVLINRDIQGLQGCE